MSTKRNLFRRIAQLTAREARTTDHIVVTGTDGHDALIPIADLTNVNPVESASQIAAIRIQTSDGTQHSATVGQLVTVIAPALPKEASLAAVSSIDEIAHIRIITKAGGSRKATPAQAANLLAPLLAPQLAPLLGIDYSKLEEQIVPGEYWLDFDGVRRQVYTRTLQINYPAGYVKDATYGIIINGATYGIIRLMSIIEIKGCRADNNFTSSDGSCVVNINDILTAKIRGGNWGGVVWFYGESYATPCTITLNLKYTRL